MLPPRPATPEEPMPKVYYDPSLGKDSVVDVGLRESGHLRDDIAVKASLDAAAVTARVESEKEKATGVESQTVISSPCDFQSARPVETFEFRRNVVVESDGGLKGATQEASVTEEKATDKKAQTEIFSPFDFQKAQEAQRKTFEFKRDAFIKSDGGLKNAAQEKQRLANAPNLQNLDATLKNDASKTVNSSKEAVDSPAKAATTTPKSASPHTTDAADLVTSTAGSTESAYPDSFSKNDNTSTAVDSSGRKVIKPVSRRSAKTSIDPAHTAQGYFAPKKALSSTPITAASPFSATSKDLSTSAFKPPVPERQAASTPNPTTPTNPFYATNMTLPIAAGNIIAYFREAHQWLAFWRDTLSTSELADLLRAKWDPKLKQITWHFACTVEFLEKGREGWKLTRLPEEFFVDALVLVEGVGGLCKEMEERKRCQGILEGVRGDVERVGRLLEGIREARWEEGRARWEAGLKAKGESG